jgi:hypothetical protein
MDFKSMKKELTKNGLTLAQNSRDKASKTSYPRP